MGTMQVSTATFGLLFATTSSGILAGSTTNSVLARRGVPSHVPLAIGLTIAPVAALAATLMVLAGVVSVPTFIPFIVVVGFCRGLSTPNITHSALEPVPHHAGVTAALMGCGQMLCMALSSVIVASLYPVLGVLSVTMAMVVFLSTGLAAWLVVERAGQVPRVA